MNTTPEQDKQNIIDRAVYDLFKKYDAGQNEHQSRLQTGSLGFFVQAAREEAVDQISYTHHLFNKLAELRLILMEMDLGLLTLREAAGKLRPILSDNPPKKNA